MINGYGNEYGNSHEDLHGSSNAHGNEHEHAPQYQRRSIDMFQDSNIEKQESEKLPRLLNVLEVTNILGLGQSTVYLLIQRGELPCVRIRRSVRVRQEDLEAFIEANVEEGSGN
jgi:excisionase family DNA binding protein